MVAEITNQWRGAVVTLKDRAGNVMERPAAFVFAMPGGFGWLEPGYADEWPAPMPTWHEVKAAITRASSTLITFGGPEWSGDIEEYFGQTGAEALEWFDRWLNRQGRTWAQERARVIAEGIVPDLVCAAKEEA